MPRPPFDHFHFIAPVYERFSNGEATFEQLAAPLMLPTSGLLLDAGGGTGRISKALAGNGNTGGVIVLDASAGMLQQARQKNGLAPVLGLTEKLPFPDGAFARILIVDAFHHFFQHEAAVRELWRVLQPGGRLLIHEPNIARWPVKLIALGETLLLMRSRFYDVEALAGFFAPFPAAKVAVDTDSDPYIIHLLVEKSAG